jgi:hypothetical protein
MIWEVAVEIAPAAVPGRTDAHYRVPLGRDGRPIERHVVPAAERGGRLAGVDRDLLTTPGGQGPQIGHGEAHRSERGRTGLADAERRRQDGVGAAADLDRPGALIAPAVRRASLVISSSGPPMFLPRRGGRGPHVILLQLWQGWLPLLVATPNSCPIAPRRDRYLQLTARLGEARAGDPVRVDDLLDRMCPDLFV